MKRYLLIPFMIPVMLLLWKLVLSADRLHAWKYSENAAPPTPSDQNFAALAFFTALLTPLLIGWIAGIVAHRRKYQSRWPVPETGIVAFIYLMFIIGVIYPNLIMKISGLATFGIVGASCLAGGVIVVTMMNMGACVCHWNGLKFANSILVFIGASLYLLWLYTFVIYIDT